MQKISLLLVTASVMAFSTAAFAADEKYESKTKVEKGSDGDYKEKTTTSNTDAAGTTTSSEHKVKVDVKSDGTTSKTVQDENTTDPKGMMNKETTKVKDTEKTHTDGTVDTTHKKTVNGKTTEDTNEKH